MIMLWFTPEMWQEMNRVQSRYWALLSSGGCLSLNVKDQLTPFALEHSSEVWPLSALQGGAGEGATLQLWNWQDFEWKGLLVEIAPSWRGDAERLEGSGGPASTYSRLSNRLPPGTGTGPQGVNQQPVSVDTSGHCLSTGYFYLTSVHNIWCCQTL